MTQRVPRDDSSTASSSDDRPTGSTWPTTQPNDPAARVETKTPATQSSAPVPSGSATALASAEFAHAGQPAALPTLEVDRAMRSLTRRLFDRQVEPPRVGRYEILRRLGSGGMGVVYEAHDPELRRNVALKVVRHDGTLGTGERLLREARAMAKLEHPEVVRVFDAGRHGTDVYLTMELVRGTNLRQWLALAPHPVSEIVDVFEACARALAAIHDAGLVHRDFKPENVLIADDGRVRVGDFGLVRDPDDVAGSLTAGFLTATTWSDFVRPPSADAPQPSAFSGTVFGTPAYMSPEHHRGMKVDARSDQYSFGIALYEACRGHLPFSGRTLAELLHAKTHQPLDLRTGRRRLARGLRNMLARCLEPQAKDRFANMHEVAALLAARQPRSKRYLALAGALGIGGALAGASLTDHEPCADVASFVEALDLDRAKPSIQAAFDRSGRSFAAGAFANTLGALTRYATQLAEERQANCVATHDRISQSPAMFATRSACLDVHEHQLRTLVERLQRADASMVDHAWSAATQLPAVVECRDPHRLDDRRRLYADTRHVEAQTELARNIASVHASFLLGAYPTGVADGERLVEKARKLEDPATLAASLFALAENQGALVSAGEDPRPAANEAVDWAEAAGDELLAARAWSFLVGTASDVDSPASPGHAVWRRAQAAVRRLGEPLERVAELAYHHGIALEGSGHHGAAEVAFERARKHWLDAIGPRDPRVIKAELRVARSRQLRADFMSARTAYEQSLARAEPLLGRSHPVLVQARFDLARTYMELGRLDQAQRSFDEVSAQWADLGLDYTSHRLDVLNAQAQLAQRRSDWTQAQRVLEQARELIATDSDLPLLSHLDTIMIAAFGAFRAERFEVAQELYQRGYELSRDRGNDPVRTADFLEGVGESLLRQGQSSAAQAALDEALRTYEQHHAGAANEAYPHKALGQLALARGDYRTAAQHFEFAVRAWLEPGSDPIERGEAQLGLAQAYVGLRRPLALVRATANDAHTSFLHAGPAGTSYLERTTAFLLKPRSVP